MAGAAPGRTTWQTDDVPVMIQCLRAAPARTRSGPTPMSLSGPAPCARCNYLRRPSVLQQGGLLPGAVPYATPRVCACVWALSQWAAVPRPPRAARFWTASARVRLKIKADELLIDTAHWACVRACVLGCAGSLLCLSRARSGRRQGLLREPGLLNIQSARAALAALAALDAL